MELSNKKILVAGLGKTGISVSNFLLEKGAHVTATDTSGEDKLGEIASGLREKGITVVLGTQEPELFSEQDLIVLSPGVPHTILPVRKAVEKGVPVIGEIELASRFIEEPIIAVTGTNGKTTTTTLIGDMLEASGMKVFTGGNIGTPLIDYVAQNEKADVLVIEISSFQLDTVDTFRPEVGVILNITEDHLDRYDDMDAYALSKFTIFKNQTDSDTAIVNAGDPYIQKYSEKINGRTYSFNETRFSGKGAIIETDRISIQTERAGFSIEKKDMALSGNHNMENICAAALAVIAAGGTEQGIRTGVKQFKNLHHRIEYVETVSGVTYYDDSKATNVDAVVRALEAFHRPVILIMGGRDKGGDYGLLIEPLKQKVKKLIVIGEAKDLIVSSIGKYSDTVEAANMAEAVRISHSIAEAGDIVLLSPACASFDMYTSYSERGKDFARSVLKLKEVTL